MGLEVQHKTTGHENQGPRGIAYIKKSFLVVMDKHIKFQRFGLDNRSVFSGFTIDASNFSSLNYITRFPECLDLGCIEIMGPQHDFTVLRTR